MPQWPRYSATRSPRSTRCDVRDSRAGSRPGDWQARVSIGCACFRGPDGRRSSGARDQGVCLWIADICCRCRVMPRRRWCTASVELPVQRARCGLAALDCGRRGGAESLRRGEVNRVRGLLRQPLKSGELESRRTASACSAANRLRAPSRASECGPRGRQPSTPRRGKPSTSVADRSRYSAVSWHARVAARMTCSGPMYGWRRSAASWSAQRSSSSMGIVVGRCSDAAGCPSASSS